MSRTITLNKLILVFSLVVVVVSAHGDLQQRGIHDNMRRMMKKRTPMPQASGPVGVPAPLLQPSKSDSTSSPTSSVPGSTTSLSTLSSSSSTSDSRSVLSSTTSSLQASVPSSASSVSAISSSSIPLPTPTTDDGAGGVSTVIVPGVTRTSSVAVSESVLPDKQGSTSSSQAKSTTLTVLIAIAASVGGIFIAWTIFRKWKLSSSKEFDSRLKPVDWQPTTAEDDDHLPGHARRLSHGSSSGHGHGAAGLSRVPSQQSHTNPFDDFERPAQQAGAVQVGGYADLSRGSSPTQMQERHQYIPTYNHGVSQIPLHHQGGY